MDSPTLRTSAKSHAVIAVLVAAVITLLGAAGALGSVTLPALAAGGVAASDLDGLEFLIGDWNHSGTIAPESFGNQAGAFAGPVECRWGAFRTWIACEHWTEQLAGLGRYAVHVMIRSDAGTGGLVGHVVNPYGSATYEGSLEAPDRLVFVGGRRQVQRVVYEQLADGRIRFTVASSEDGGDTFVPHTDGLWERTGR